MNCSLLAFRGFWKVTYYVLPTELCEPSSFINYLISSVEEDATMYVLLNDVVQQKTGGSSYFPRWYVKIKFFA